MGWRLARVVSVFLLSGIALQAQQPPPIFNQSPEARAIGTSRKPGWKPRQQAAPSGLACLTMDFYGVVDRQPLPTFFGVTSTGWVGANSVDYGGQAYFDPPQGSPPYVAVFLNGLTNTIEFSCPDGQSVSYQYATALQPTTVTAYNAQGAVVAAAAISGELE